MKNGSQEIYINLDDSGKLTTKEEISVYGGLVFLCKKNCFGLCFKHNPKQFKFN